MTLEQGLGVALLVAGLIIVQLVAYQNAYAKALKDRTVTVAGSRVTEHFAVERGRWASRAAAIIYLVVVGLACAVFAW